MESASDELQREAQALAHELAGLYGNSPLAEVGARLIDSLEGVAHAVAAGQPPHMLASTIASARWTRDALPQSFGDRFQFDASLIQAILKRWSAQGASFSNFCVPRYGPGWGFSKVPMPSENREVSQTVRVISFPGSDRVADVDLSEYPWLLHELAHDAFFSSRGFMEAFSKHLIRRVRDLKLRASADRGSAAHRSAERIATLERYWTPKTTQLDWAHEVAVDVAALMAASLGVTEVFKRVFEIPEEIAPLLERTEFSLWDLTTSPENVGPPLPERMRWPDTLLTGAGAIGNAIALLLAQLRIAGRAHIIDRQDYRDENMGTCVLMEKNGWLNEPKAVRLAAWLKEHGALVVTGDKIAIETAITENRLGALAIDLILNGLDDVDARRETQRLWPSVIVDGGINEVGAAVVQHRLDRPESACLMCWFETANTNEKALQSRWTGLHRDSLHDANRQLSDQDIAAADQSKREWLGERQREGKTVCSIITEAQLAARLGITANDGFRPSVPFVATASASLVVAAAVKTHAFPQAPAPSMFQVGSLFLGPEHSASIDRVPTSRCQCVTQRRIIEAVRSARARRT